MVDDLTQGDAPLRWPQSIPRFDTEPKVGGPATIAPVLGCRRAGKSMQWEIFLRALFVVLGIGLAGWIVFFSRPLFPDADVVIILFFVQMVGVTILMITYGAVRLWRWLRQFRDASMTYEDTYEETMRLQHLRNGKTACKTNRTLVTKRPALAGFVGATRSRTGPMITNRVQVRTQGGPQFQSYTIREKMLRHRMGNCSVSATHRSGLLQF